jgi:transposase
MENKKNEVLREHGSLNPQPQKVTDEFFTTKEFFDPRDIIQVKYEMLRRVRVEGQSVAHVSSKFGFSRVAFYQMQRTYEQGGLPALIPKHRGPKHAHKLTDTILSFINKQRTNDKTLRAPALSKLVQKQFGLSIHPRSIERALLRQQKKGR